MHFGFALELSDIGLWNLDLLDTHLDTDIPSKYFVSLNSVFKTFSRYVFKTSWRQVFKTSSRHVFKTSSRRLQRDNFSSSKTSSRRLQDVFARHLQYVLEDEKLLRWRHFEIVFKTCLQDVFKTNKCLLGSYFKLSVSETVKLPQVDVKLVQMIMREVLVTNKK